MPQSLLPILTAFLASSYITPVSANPLMSNLGGLSIQQLFGRGTCAVPCGWAGQLCCAAGQACYTDAANQAQCSNTAALTLAATIAGSNGYWNVYTTTFVQSELVTITSVVSSWCASTAPATVYATPTSVAAPAATPVCDYASNQSPCGSICCASDQYCVTPGQCAAAAVGGSSAFYSSQWASTAAGSQTGFSAPLRPTSSTLLVLTSTASPTTTEPFMAPVATGANITLIPTEAQHKAGLSSGAIAGIVIGVLLGIALLLLLCFCFCLKKGFDGLLAIFGLGKRRRRTRETEYIEEYHHHSSRNGRGESRSWYGSGPRRPERREKKSNGLGNLLPIAGGLAGLWALLGLKRRNDRRRDDEKSDYTSSYGSYYTSESSASSDDRRTRDTRRSSRR
ncbi:hypothetical protein MBLNU457_5496t2 [Dothideomycetes sp. NU457]